MPNKLKLTTTAVDRLKAAGIYWDTQTPGLGVRVADSGMQTYFYKRRVKGSGVERNVKLGRQGEPVLLSDGSVRSYPFGADDARTKAATVQAQLLAGIDPVQQRRDNEAAAVARAEQDKALATTLRQVMADYFEHHRVKNRPLRPKTKLDYRQFLERHFADWLDEPVAKITRGMCLDKITEIEKRSPILMHKGSTYLRLFLNHAREMHADQKTGEYTILAVNPAERARKIKKTHPPKARDRSIDVTKIGAVWSTLRRRAENPVKDLDRTAADWVSALLLTGWRATECAALEWSWINFDAKTITIPGDVETEDERLFAGVKTHAEMTWPMSDALFDILKARSELEGKDERYVFPSRADNGMPYIKHARGTIKAIMKVAGMTTLSPHDLRRTAVRVAIAARVDYALRMRMLNHAPAGVHDDYERDANPETLRPGVNAVASYILDAAKVAEAQAAGTNVIMIKFAG